MTAYRDSAPLCPTCREPMEPFTTRAPAAIIDLCTKCGGVWIDWEDGDMTELARAVPPAGARSMPRDGAGGCPRCNRPLEVEVFLDTAEVLRCSDCAGAFLPYASIGKIASSTPADAREEEEEAYSPETSMNLEPESLFRRAIMVVRGWTRPEGG